MEISNAYLQKHFGNQIMNAESDLYNHDYEGMSFVLNDEHYQSRLGKKTPTKAGYFLAIWQKNDDGNNIPYTTDFNIEYLMVIIKDGSHEGYFKFPKNVLIDQGILTISKHNGKMAFRVYAPWNHDLNLSATQTQKWQNNYFVDTSNRIF